MQDQAQFFFVQWSSFLILPKKQSICHSRLFCGASFIKYQVHIFKLSIVFLCFAVFLYQRYTIVTTDFQWSHTTIIFSLPFLY